MGMSIKSVPFFTGSLTIVPHTANGPAADLLGLPVTLEQFAKTGRVGNLDPAIRLDQIEDGPRAGEYIASYGTPGTDTYTFMEGPPR